MARLGCRCGFSMWNGRVPNEIEFTAFSDIRFCEIVENPPASLIESIDDLTCLLNNLMELADYEVWRCPQCGRLYVFDNKDDPNRAKYVYRLEEA